MALTLRAKGSSGFVCNDDAVPRVLWLASAVSRCQWLLPCFHVGMAWLGRSACRTWAGCRCSARVPRSGSQLDEAAFRSLPEPTWTGPGGDTTGIKPNLSGDRPAVAREGGRAAPEGQAMFGVKGACRVGWAGKSSAPLCDAYISGRQSY